MGLQETTDNAIFFLAEHTPTLRRLHVSQCPRISLEAIHILIDKLPNLEHLSATGLPSLKRVGIQRFSDVPPSVSKAICKLTYKQTRQGANRVYVVMQGYDKRLQGLYRVFNGPKVQQLRVFLDKEDRRRREAEQKNIIFSPRGDDSEDLY